MIQFNGWCLSYNAESRTYGTGAPRSSPYYCCWALKLLLVDSREHELNDRIIIIVIVLAIRQFAAWSSTLITREYSRQKITTEIREIYAQNLL